jgi:hypothetical protein
MSVCVLRQSHIQWLPEALRQVKRCERKADLSLKTTQPSGIWRRVVSQEESDVSEERTAYIIGLLPRDYMVPYPKRRVTFIAAAVRTSKITYVSLTHGAEIKNTCRFILTPPHKSWHVLNLTHRESFSFTFTLLLIAGDQFIQDQMGRPRARIGKL